MARDVALMRKRVDDLFGLLSALSPTSVVPKGYKKAKLEQACATKQLRYLKSRVSILKDALKEIDVKMEVMIEASMKKKNQDVRKLFKDALKEIDVKMEKMV
jgi:S-adenosylmethionine synthetase